MRKDIMNRLDQVRTGEIPEGYQSHRGIGIAPLDWKVGQLSNIVKNVRRLVSKPDVAYWRLGIRSHAKGTFHEYVEDPDTVAMDELFLVNENDLIVNITFAWEHAIALAGINDAGKLVSHRFPTYVFKKGHIPKYYASVVVQPRFKDMLVNISPGGAGRNRVLSKADFLKLPCYLPLEKEQQKIAEILSHCDKVIALKQQLIDEERKRKTWLIQNLFDPNSGVRLYGFQSQWKTATMGELFDFGSSLSASRTELSEEGICYLHYGDIHSKYSGFIDVQAEFDGIPKLYTSNYAQYLLHDGDVVFVDASEDYEGASKYVVIVNPKATPFVAGLHTIPARSKTDALDIGFKMYCFQTYSFKKQVAFYVSGMKVYGLNKYNLAKISIDYPDSAEQIAIAEIMISVDDRIKLLEQELIQWQQKKKALMQLLLTGLVRVTA